MTSTGFDIGHMDWEWVVEIMHHLAVFFGFHRWSHWGFPRRQHFLLYSEPSIRLPVIFNFLCFCNWQYYHLIARPHCMYASLNADWCVVSRHKVLLVEVLTSWPWNFGSGALLLVGAKAVYPCPERFTPPGGPTVSPAVPEGKLGGSWMFGFIACNLDFEWWSHEATVRAVSTYLIFLFSVEIAVSIINHVMFSSSESSTSHVCSPTSPIKSLIVTISHDVRVASRSVSLYLLRPPLGEWLSLSPGTSKLEMWLSNSGCLGT